LNQGRRGGKRQKVTNTGKLRTEGREVRRSVIALTGLEGAAVYFPLTLYRLCKEKFKTSKHISHRLLLRSSICFLYSFLLPDWAIKGLAVTKTFVSSSSCVYVRVVEMKLVRVLNLVLLFKKTLKAIDFGQSDNIIIVQLAALGRQGM
jgi:hypothetical protein